MERGRCCLRRRKESLEAISGEEVESRAAAGDFNGGFNAEISLGGIPSGKR